MARSRQLLMLAGAPMLIVTVMALSALLAVRLETASGDLEPSAGDAHTVVTIPGRREATPIPRPTATPAPVRAVSSAATVDDQSSSSKRVGCCAQSPISPTRTTPSTVTVPAETKAQDGIAIETLDGTSVRVAVPRDDVVAVVSMAVGCASCIQELRAWAEIYPDYQSQDVTLVVLSINPYEDPETLKQVLATVGVSKAVAAIDYDGEVSRALGIQTLDQTLIFDRSGHLTFSDSVPTTIATLDDALSKASVG